MIGIVEDARRHARQCAEHFAEERLFAVAGRLYWRVVDHGRCRRLVDDDERLLRRLGLR